MNEFEWQRQLRDLAQPRQPQRDLWAGIAAGIATPARVQRSRQPMWWAAAAMLLLTVGATLLLQRHIGTPAESTLAALDTPATTNADAPGAALAQNGDAGGSRLAPPLERTALDWANPTERHLTGAARELDSATAELQQAMELRPDAVFLVGLLNRTNAQRMRLTRISATAG